MKNEVKNEGSQMELNYETIRDARCFDATAPRGKEMFRQDIIPHGDGIFTNADGDLYEIAIPKGSDSEDGYVLIEKKDVPEPVRTEIARLKERRPDRTWVDCYQEAVLNLENQGNGGLAKSNPLDPMLR
jgi:hypothetical protein